MYSRIYIYKFLTQNSSKVLSAWMSFVVRGVIKQVQFIDSDLYMIVAYQGQLQLEKINLSEGEKDPEGRITYLDHRVEFDLASTTSNTTVTLPYTPEITDNVQAVTASGELLEISVNGDEVSLPDGIIGKIYVGLQYRMTYVLSEQRFTATATKSKVSSNSSKLHIKNANLFYSDSSNFSFSVLPEHNTPATTSLDTVREDPSVVNLQSDVLRCPVYAQGRGTELVIENGTPFPSNLQNIEFESFVYPRGKQYG